MRSKVHLKRSMESNTEKMFKYAFKKSFKDYENSKLEQSYRYLHLESVLSDPDLVKRIK